MRFGVLHVFFDNLFDILPLSTRILPEITRHLGNRVKGSSYSQAAKKPEKQELFGILEVGWI